MGNKCSFGFGYRMYYWPYYKDNQEEDYMHNPGMTYSDMYVHKIFDNFKEEMLDKLDAKQYKITYKKCKQYSKCDEMRYIQSRNYNKTFHYDIKWHIVLDIYHLLSIVFYTDYNEL